MARQGNGARTRDVPIWLGCLAEQIIVAQDAFLANTQLKSVHARHMALLLGTDICQFAADLLAYLSQRESFCLEIEELRLKLLATENVPKGGWDDKYGYASLLKNPAGYRASCLVRSATRGLKLTGEQQRQLSNFSLFRHLCDIYPHGLCCKLCWERIGSYEDFLDHKDSHVHTTRVDALDRFLDKFRKAYSDLAYQSGNDKDIVSTCIAGAHLAPLVPFMEYHQGYDWIWAARSILAPLTERQPASHLRVAERAAQESRGQLAASREEGAAHSEKHERAAQESRGQPATSRRAGAAHREKHGFVAAAVKQQAKSAVIVKETDHSGQPGCVATAVKQQAKPAVNIKAPAQEFCCSICSLSVASAAALATHESGKKHQKQLRRLAEQEAAQQAAEAALQLAAVRAEVAAEQAVKVTLQQESERAEALRKRNEVAQASAGAGAKTSGSKQNPTRDLKQESVAPQNRAGQGHLLSACKVSNNTTVRPQPPSPDVSCFTKRQLNVLQHQILKYKAIEERLGRANLLVERKASADDKILPLPKNISQNTAGELQQLPPPKLTQHRSTIDSSKGSVPMKPTVLKHAQFVPPPPPPVRRPVPLLQPKPPQAGPPRRTTGKDAVQPAQREQGQYAQATGPLPRNNPPVPLVRATQPRPLFLGPVSLSQPVPSADDEDLDVSLDFLMPASRSSGPAGSAVHSSQTAASSTAKEAAQREHLTPGREGCASAQLGPSPAGSRAPEDKVKPAALLANMTSPTVVSGEVKSSHAIEEGEDPLSSMLRCPITHEIMHDPMIAADGFTYERSAIDEWLRKSDTSPMTNATLTHKVLTPNHVLRSVIAATVTMKQSKQREF